MVLLKGEKEGKKGRDIHAPARLLPRNMAWLASFRPSSPCFPWVIDASQTPSTKNIAEHVAMGDRGKWSSRQEKKKSWP